MRTKSIVSRAFEAVRGVLRPSCSGRGGISTGTRTREGESGQALVLVGLAGTVLVGFLALAVDVGNLYLVRRQAQSAADAAALVGAQDKQGVIPDVTLIVNDAVRDARRYAIQNGFQTDSGANNGTWNQEVRVDVPPASGPYAGRMDYIEVRIRRPLPALFTGLFGVTFEASARAVARARHLGIEAATISLYPGDPSTVVNGSANIGVVGNTYSRGITQNMAGVLNVSGYAFAGTGFEGTVNATLGLVSGVAELYDPRWGPCGPIDPNPGISWNSNGVVERQTLDGDGYVWISPGTYDWINIRSSDRVKFRPGVYRTTKSQGVNINGDAIGTGPICFVMDPVATFNAQGDGTIALSSGPIYNNILIWTSNCSTNAVKIAGSNDVLPGFGSPFQGTIYAPCGTVRLSGGSTGSVRGQVFGYVIALEGGNGTAVVYDANLAPGLPGPALVE
ncbi:MAG: hypothetical protein HY675_06955 [Chloroflexi bacterium]|nr:hypothetical protein [Chloroflexota bacterium]